MRKAKNLGLCGGCGASRNTANTLLIGFDDTLELRNCRCGSTFSSRKLLIPDSVRLDPETYDQWLCEICPDDLSEDHRSILGIGPESPEGLTLEGIGSFTVEGRCPDLSISVEHLSLEYGGRVLDILRPDLRTDIIEEALQDTFDPVAFREAQEASDLERCLDGWIESLGGD